MAEGNTTTWAEWGKSLAGPVPVDVPLVPGHSELQKDWSSYGRAWGEHYQSSRTKPTAPAPPPAPAPPSALAPPEAPQLPHTEASESDWETYGRFIGGYNAALNHSSTLPEPEARGNTWAEYGEAIADAAKETTRGNWSEYGKTWSAYGRSFGDKYRHGPPSDIKGSPSA